MFERFDTWAQQVVAAAQDEARELRHPTLGPEHLLLGVLHDEGGLGGEVLRRLGLRLEDERATTAASLGVGERATAGQIPFTPAARQVLEQAMREAMSLGHDGVSSEHVLLALAREDRVGRLAGRHVRDEVLLAIEVGVPTQPDPAAAQLLSILAADGAAAALLREHGVDEEAVRTRLTGA